jgi:hypothetical protein
MNLRATSAARSSQNDHIRAFIHVSKITVSVNRTPMVATPSLSAEVSRRRDGPMSIRPGVTHLLRQSNRFVTALGLQNQLAEDVL